MAVAVTNSNITAYNTVTTITDNPATSSVVDATEVFTITPTKPDGRVLIEIENGPTHGTVTYSIAAGGFWAAGSALTGSVAQDTKRGIVLESGKYKSAAGTIAITFTPASGKRLLTDHLLKMRVTQLPG
jgi:hypothetical protein